MIRKLMSWLKGSPQASEELRVQRDENLLEEEPHNKRQMHQQDKRSKDVLEEFIQRNEAGALLILSPRQENQQTFEESKEEESEEQPLNSKLITITNEKNQKVDALLVYPKKSIQRVVKQHEVIQRCLEKAKNPASLEMQCPICLDLFLNPVMASCGHVYCNECYTEATLARKECSVCRKNIRARDPIECRTFSSLIEQILENDPEEKARYNQRKQDLRKIEQARRVLNIQPGEEMDVRDTEYIWCPAVVRLTMNIHRKGLFLVVHYLGWSNVYDEAIPIDSRRLARRGFYTKRRDIPRYILENRRGNNYYAHIAHDGEDDDLDFNLPALGSRSYLESSRRLLDRSSDNPFRPSSRMSALRDGLFSFSRDNRDSSSYRFGSGLFSRWRGDDINQRLESIRRSSPPRSLSQIQNRYGSLFESSRFSGRLNPFTGLNENASASLPEENLNAPQPAAASAENENAPVPESQNRSSSTNPSSEPLRPQAASSGNSPQQEPAGEAQEANASVIPEISAAQLGDESFSFSFRSLNSENQPRDQDEPHPLLEVERNQRIGSDWLSHQENRIRRDMQENREAGDGINLEIVQFLRNGRRNFFEHQNHPNRNS